MGIQILQGAAVILDGINNKDKKWKQVRLFIEMEEAS